MGYLSAPGQRIQFWFAITIFLAVVTGCGLSQRDIETLSSKCSRGDLLSCQEVGIDHARFNRSEEARLALGRACMGGYALSCHHLGMREIQEEDIREGQSHLERACSLGYSFSCSMRAYVAERYGETAVAAKYYSIACNARDGRACQALRALEQNR